MFHQWESILFHRLVEPMRSRSLPPSGNNSKHIEDVDYFLPLSPLSLSSNRTRSQLVSSNFLQKRS